MKRSEQRILTSHGGSLPRPPELQALNQQKQSGQTIDEAQRWTLVKASVPEVVQKQVECGVDIVGDGEYGKTNFLNYIRERLGGFEATGDIEFSGAMADRRDRRAFLQFYQDELSGRGGGGRPQLVCTAPVTYTGTSQLQTDLENFKAALQGKTYEEGFIPALAPTYTGDNRYYPNEDEYLTAVADAMRVEYEAIINAGYILQIDDPGLPAFWEAYIPAINVEEYRKIAARKIEVLNYALRDLPEDRIRYHICWGSWHGPHSEDIPLADIVDLVLAVRAQTYSLEAANVRHEHEWRVWGDVKLPAGKILMPGVVGHATNVLEHPRLVADRIVKYAGLVGRENVIAGTDCGLGGRLHPQLVWAKLKVLSEGAELATRELWS